MTSIQKMILGFAAVSAFFAFSGSAFAKPQYFNMLQAKVGVPLNQQRCNNCHGGNNPQARNLFGQDFEKIILRGQVDLGFRPLTDEEKWKVLFEKDSDKDGISNLEEMRQGRNPGVAGK